MKYSLHIFTLIMGLVVVLILPSNISAKEGFTDVDKNNSHYEGIHWLMQKGVIRGYPDGTFDPGGKLTREHAAAIFVAMKDLELTSGANINEVFSDVKSSYGYAQEIATAHKAGIFIGDDGKFKPGDPLTREQMATTLVQAFDLHSDGSNVDINLQNVSESHKGNVQILADLGITRELEDYRPGENTTRGQFATFLYKTDEVLNEPSVKVVDQSYNYSFQNLVHKQRRKGYPQTDARGKWYDASDEMVKYYANPNNFKEGTDAVYQFLKLSGSSGVNSKDINRDILADKGILSNKADLFKAAGEQYNVNEIYLISHALLETGDGKSDLATGVEVGINKKGESTMVTSKNKGKLTAIKTAYNFFGVRAIDNCPLKCGSEHAYDEGWFTPEAAINGGAEFISRNYIGAGQDTLYKMRWNPEKTGSHQYATDVGWAVKQTAEIKDMFEEYKDMNGIQMVFEVPNFQDQPSSTPLPTGIDVFHVNTNHKYVGKTAIVTADMLNIRSGPTTGFTKIGQIPEHKTVTIIGENSNWYKVSYDNNIGWVSGAYLDFGKKKGNAKVLSISETSDSESDETTESDASSESKKTDESQEATESDKVDESDETNEKEESVESEEEGEPNKPSQSEETEGTEEVSEQEGDTESGDVTQSEKQLENEANDKDTNNEENDQAGTNEQEQNE